MDTNSLATVIVTAITVLGSAKAWSFYEKKLVHKEKNDNFFINNCEERISKLEKLLEKSSADKDEMRKTILTLTAEVAELRIKVEFLEHENDELKSINVKRFLNE